MPQKNKKGGVDDKDRTKIVAGLLTSLLFLLPYERIPSLPIHLLGTSVDLRLSFLAGSGLILAIILYRVTQTIRLNKNLLPTHYLLGAFFFTYLLAALLSGDLKRALVVWAFTLFTAAVGVAVSLAWQNRDSVMLRRALWLTTWLVLIFGFYQYFGDVFGLSTTWTGLRDIYTKQVFGFPRIQSTGLEPLFYANFLLIPFFYFCTRFLTGEEERPFLLVALVTQLVLTVSRGALIGGIVGLALLLCVLVRRVDLKQRVGLVGVVIVGVTFALLLTNVGSFKFGNIQPTTQPTTTTPAAVAVIGQATNLTSQDDRVRNRNLALQAFEEHPIFGIGPGNFSAYAKDHFLVYRSADGYIVVNNEPLELLAEGGLVSFVLFLSFVLLVIWGLLRIIWAQNISDDFDWGVTVLAYLVALAIQYQTFSTLYIMHIWVMLGIGMGIIGLHFTSLNQLIKGQVIIPKPSTKSLHSNRSKAKSQSN